MFKKKKLLSFITRRFVTKKNEFSVKNNVYYNHGTGNHNK